MFVASSLILNISLFFHCHRLVCIFVVMLPCFCRELRRTRISHDKNDPSRRMHLVLSLFITAWLFVMVDGQPTSNERRQILIIIKYNKIGKLFAVCHSTPLILNSFVVFKWCHQPARIQLFCRSSAGRPGLGSKAMNMEWWCQYWWQDFYIASLTLQTGQHVYCYCCSIEVTK